MRHILQEERRQAMKTESLLWILVWAVLGTVLLIGQYSLLQGREDARLHAQVDASMVPPSTRNVSTR